MKITKAKRFKFKGVINFNRKDTLLFINLWNEHIEKYGFLSLRVLEQDILAMFLIPVNEDHIYTREFYGYTETIGIGDFVMTKLSFNDARYRFRIPTPQSYKHLLRVGY